MATTYQKFLNTKIDLSPLGIEPNGNDSGYFCTPKGANIIGRSGVDGIHYCFIRGFGEMVFVVNPMQTPGNYVRPIAQTFADFLRLLLSCHCEAALEQAYTFDQAQFDDFLENNPATQEQQKVLDALRRQMKLVPMDAPFSYIRKLEFDASKISYTEDLNDPDRNKCAAPMLPEWHVSFEGNFFGRRGRGRAGTEIPIGREFFWGQNRCLAPCVYSCSKGLVMDFCIQVSFDRIRAFLDKWNLSIDHDDPRHFTKEQQMQIEAENPLNIPFRPCAVVNGAVLQADHGSCVCWNPCVPDGYRQDFEAQAAIQHYGLDPSDGWAISRHSFRLATKRKPSIKSLAVTLKPDRVAIPGPCFQVAAPGDRFAFQYPSTGQNHTLTVQEYAHRELPKGRLAFLPDQELPAHYTMMSYTITPDLPDGVVRVQDCVQSDPPRAKGQGPRKPESLSSSGCIGIIGGADGPTAISLGRQGQGTPRAACSALHFEPAKNVTWRMVFHEAQLDDLTVTLL